MLVTGAFLKPVLHKYLFVLLLFLLSMTNNYIWKPPAYPYELQPQLISILQMFEVAFQMPDSNFLLVPSLLPLEKPRI